MHPREVALITHDASRDAQSRRSSEPGGVAMKHQFCIRLRCRARAAVCPASGQPGTEPLSAATQNIPSEGFSEGRE